MALLKMIFRKMVKNKVFVFFLAIGLLISTALLSSIPMYTEGALQKSLIKDMEGLQETQNVFPGSVMISYYCDNTSVDSAIKKIGKPDKSIFTYSSVKEQYTKRFDEFNKVDKYSKENISSKLEAQALSKFANYSTGARTLIPDKALMGYDEDAFATLESYTDFNQHINILYGRIPTKTKDGIYEVLVSDLAVNKLNINLEKVYILKDSTKFGFEDIKVKPVGAFNVKDVNDTYWGYLKPIMLQNSIILDETTMVNDFVKSNPTQIDKARWFYAIDYHLLNINKLKSLISNVKGINKDLHKINKNVVIEVPISGVISSYNDKTKQVINMMWSLNVPVIVILCLYMFMVSRLTIDRERNEISLLSSRGAGKYQVIFGYIVEGGFLSSIAIIIGPFLGYYICKFLGASSGFLEFVDRKPIDTSISFNSYMYVLVAVFIFMITLIIPAYKATKTNIVDYKKKIGRRANLPIWEKFFVDFLLLAMAGYGFYNFIQRQKLIIKTGINAAEMKIDPLLFIVPVLFIIGIGLLFLRIYPYIIRFIYFIGKKFWPPSIYTALTQVGRSIRSYDFLMIFLMLTLSVGIFSANAARTINKNAQEKIMYSNGADIIIENTWKAKDLMEGVAQKEPVAKEGDIAKNTEKPKYEPSFTPYTNLKGIQHVTKVFTKDKVKVGPPQSPNGYAIDGFNLMAIEPSHFGQVAWFRDGLMSHHINEYLNLLTSEPSACLISKSMHDDFGGMIGVGTSMLVSWDDKPGVLLNVYGIIDYWPTFNPNKLTSGKGLTGFDDPMLIISNLDYIQNNVGVEEYKVWLKMKPDGTSKEVYDSLTANEISPTKISDSKQEIIKLKNDPFQLAINGSLTMGFIISGLICFMGFVLYWVLSLKSRSLQFGVLRAMGLTSLQLKVMIIWEQLLTSGMAMFMGVIIGLATSKYFVPFFQMSFSGNSQSIPFKVISYASDMAKVYGFIGITIFLGVGVLIYMLSKIKISNVIKLGED